MKNKQIFDRIDRVIIREVYPLKNIGLSCYGIAKRTGVSWITVKKRLKNLINKNILIKEKEGNVKFNYALTSKGVGK